MGILGSAFGRALAGAGQAGAAIANKYIDEDLAKQRAQAFADIQHANTVRAEEYQQSAPVQERRASNAANQTLLQAAAGRKAKTEGIGDAGYQAALDAESDAETGRKVKSANQVLEGTTDAEVKRNTAIGTAKTDEDIRRATAMLPLEVKKAYAVADAAGRASARNREAPGADLQAKLRIVRDTLGRDLTEPEKLGLLGLAKGRDPELDTETIKTVDPTTGAETTRKQVRRPGAGGPADAVDPYKVPDRPGKPGAAGDPYSKDGKPTATRTAAGPEAPARATDTNAPGSPGAKQYALMEAARAKQASAPSLSSAMASAERASAQAAAAPLIQARDIRALENFQQTPEYSALDSGTKSKIFAVINGR